ncbi:formamidopyrimidine-DNA glycosylase [bacterium]|nr:formamidopyrimidine-DNA glycosylase [bacterium]
MPEFPELEVTRERLGQALLGRPVAEAKLYDPFVLRTVDPPWDGLAGRRVTAVLRQAKFLVIRFGDVDLAIHLMLGGRLRLREPAKFKPHRKRTLASLTFDEDDDGAPPVLLEMTEAGTKRRASLQLFGPDSDRAKLLRGTEPLDPALDAEALAVLLRSRNQHVTRALRDPELLAGIGNAYADEILFAARLSPVKLTSRLTDDEIARLLEAVRTTLLDWTDRVRDACPEGLPARQADWRKHMAVHGRAGQPCPECGSAIGRIARKDAETNYCPACQNEGKLLADRRLSRFGIRRPPRAGS